MNNNTSHNLFPYVDGSDYVGVAGQYIFDSTTTAIDVPVTISGDNVFELIELFNASLLFFGAPIPRVTLAPDSAQVTILDDDG